jgi:hypothetical protein
MDVERHIVDGTHIIRGTARLSRENRLGVRKDFCQVTDFKQGH